MAKAPCTIEDSLGAFLRQEREARSIALDDVSKQTRVRNFYLTLIESGDYSRLPSVPIGRGFVRAYAVAIGVDADAAARQFDREFGTATQKEKEAELSAEKIAFSQVAQRSPGQRLWLPLVAVAVLILMGGVLFWSLRGKTEQYVPVTSFSERLKAAAGPMLRQVPRLLSPGKSKTAPSESRPAAAQKPVAEPQSRNDATPEKSRIFSISAVGEGGNGSPDSAPVSEAPAPAGETRSPRAAASAPPLTEVASVAPAAVPPLPSPPVGRVTADGRLALKIRALEDTWVRIVVDQREIQEFLLTAGNERFWKGSEKFILTVGNAAGTQVSLNGSSISLPQSSSNVVRDFVITEKLLN